MDVTEHGIDMIKAEKYLLGELDEDSALNFEIDVFPDESLSDDLDRIRHELAERYINEELTPEQRKNFENHFLSSLHNLKTFLFTYSLLKSVKEFSIESEPETEEAPNYRSLEPAKKNAFATFIEIFKPRKFAVPVFATLVLVFTVIAAFWVFNSKPPHLARSSTRNIEPVNSGLIGQDNDSNEISLPDNPHNNLKGENKNDAALLKSQAPTIATLLLVRGGRSQNSREPVLTIRKSDKTVKIEFFYPPKNPVKQYKTYKLSLEDAKGAEIWPAELPVNEQDEGKKKQIIISADNFRNGNFIFRIIGIDENGEPETRQKSSFKVIKLEK